MTRNPAEAADRIVDTALALAAQGSWESVRLRDVAVADGIGLDAVRRFFREKDELIDAWFDWADAAMLALADSGELAALGPRVRLARLIMAWLDALAPHRRVTRQMIQAKFEPGHLHIQIPAVMRISRTVQWLREAASLRDTGLRRALAETVLTGIYLATFACWMIDETVGAEHTRRLLDGLLARAELAALAVPGFAFG